jgi:hypothetical protein
VLSWLRNRVAGSALSADQRAQLEAWLGPLGGGLTARALAFVLRGEKEEVVAAIAARPSAGGELRLKSCNSVVTTSPLMELFSKPLPDAGHYLRIAYILAAAESGAAVAMVPGLPPGSGAPAWLEPLLWEASTYAPRHYGGQNHVYLSHELVEAVLTAGDAPADAALRALVRIDPVKTPYGLREILAGLSGLKEAAARHPEVVREGLAAGDAKGRAHLLGLLRGGEVAPQPFLDLLAAAACDEAKGTREIAEAWVRAMGAEALPALRQLLAGGDSTVRARAAAQVARMGGLAEAAFLEQRLTAERSAPVKRALEAALADLRAPAPAAVQAAVLEIPPVAPGPLPALGPEARAAMSAIAAAWYQAAHKVYQQAAKYQAAHRAQLSGHPGISPPDPPTAASIDHWLKLMQAPDFTPERAREIRWQGESIRYGVGYDWAAWARPLFALPELTLGHVVRFAALAGVLQVHERYPGLGGWNFLPMVKSFQRARGLTFGVRELAAECGAIGIEPERVGWEFLFSWRLPPGWRDEEIWPFFVEHRTMLESALGLRPLPNWTTPFDEQRMNALAILGGMPALPDGFAPLIWDLALGPARKERAVARRCLVSQAGAADRVVAALTDGRQDVREAAAEWLREARDTAAVEPLRKALARERSERCKAAFIVALEALGASLDDLIDRETLAKEAAKGLAKGIPEGLTWFPFASLPPACWSDGAALDPQVVTWWLVQARKVGSPELNPLVRCYGQRLRSGDARALGTAILEAWIAQDTAPPSEAEAIAKANAHAQQWASYVNQTPQAYAQQLLPTMRATPVGSAIADKGILAVAGALVTDAAGPLVARYLKHWYGMRAAQCKALLQMLAWVDHPTAAAVLLATATRFRTAGIRKTAEVAVQALAERRGWTVDELADRTIPSADLEDDGTLELGYGSRTFKARLRPDLTFTLEDDTGKEIAGLPEPRASDDADAAKAAKQAFAASRKQVKAVEKQQRDRLYEAMCSQRTWQFEDWQTYLAKHPIVGHLCARLIWSALDEGGTRSTFRALGDGTLTGPDDAAVVVAPAAPIMVAHPSAIAPDVVAAWRRHLTDYEIEPLFDQLGRPARPLPDDKKSEAGVEEFRGYLLQAFQLRGRATKLGYVRGQAEDGGWFFAYRRHFPSLQIEAQIEFSGNGLPEENRTVALHRLAFSRSDPRAAGASEPVALGEIPPVLLSECWNDLAALAAEGPGYDPDWEAKTTP